MKTENKVAVIGVVVGLAFAVVANAQTKVSVFQEVNVKVNAVHLTALDDGGCRASWEGAVVSDTGESQPVFAGGRELTALANQNKCNALLSAGAKAVAKQAGIVADAGVL